MILLLYRMSNTYNNYKIFWDLGALSHESLSNCFIIVRKSSITSTTFVSIDVFNSTQQTDMTSLSEKVEGPSLETCYATYPNRMNQENPKRINWENDVTLVWWLETSEIVTYTWHEYSLIQRRCEFVLFSKFLFYQMVFEFQFEIKGYCYLLFINSIRPITTEQETDNSSRRTSLVDLSFV